MTRKCQPMYHGLIDPLLPLLALPTHAQNLILKNAIFSFLLKVEFLLRSNFRKVWADEKY